ncbi:uncharacterized protein LOC125670987 isoform X2 [Ostrea edulis]|uniref:uncharacterized protein LOC125670987 isoform X2 n=1 Tax=Ostrea edulis TaxID=37623 RepID=UPI0024AF81E7|nr:uncharacterized protein LOC125670987 isoform X2 [Ostrea edulis]
MSNITDSIGVPIIFTRNRWFPKYQRWQGRRKMPRPRKPKFDLSPNQNGVKSVPSTIKVTSSRPGSRPSTQRGGDIMKLQNGSHVNTVYSANSTDHWIQEIPTPRYEEKGKQINFEEEEDEEQVIVTEVVTDLNSTHKPNVENQNISLSQTVKAEEIQMTLQKEPIESEKTTDGVMNFQFQDDDDDEAVANLSASRRGQEEEEMILY